MFAVNGYLFTFSLIIRIPDGLGANSHPVRVRGVKPSSEAEYVRYGRIVTLCVRVTVRSSLPLFSSKVPDVILLVFNNPIKLPVPMGGPTIKCSAIHVRYLD